MISNQLLRASVDRRLRRDEYRALIQLQRELDWEQYRPFKVAVLARALRLDRGNTARAIRQLVRFGYLVEGERDGSLRSFRLCTPPHGVTGDTSQAA